MILHNLSMKILILSLLLFASFSTHGSSFQNYYNNASQIAALASLYADWHTTREMGKYYETAKPETGKIYKEQGMLGLFGSHPSQGEVNIYFIGWGLINLGVNYFGSDNVRSFFNTWQFSVHYKAYNHNVSIGLSRAF